MKLYSIPEAAETLSVAYHRVYHAVSTGKIKPLTAGRSRLLDDGDLIRLRKLLAESEPATKGAK